MICIHIWSISIYLCLYPYRKIFCFSYTQKYSLERFSVSLQHPLYYIIDSQPGLQMTRPPHPPTPFIQVKSYFCTLCDTDHIVLLFHAWFLSLNIMFVQTSVLLYVVVGRQMSWVCRVSLYEYTSLFIPSTVDGHLGSFQFLAILNAVTNILAHAFWRSYVHISVRFIPRSEAEIVHLRLGLEPTGPGLEPSQNPQSPNWGHTPGFRT